MAKHGISNKTVNIEFVHHHISTVGSHKIKVWNKLNIARIRTSRVKLLLSDSAQFCQLIPLLNESGADYRSLQCLIPYDRLQ